MRLALAAVASLVVAAGPTVAQNIDPYGAQVQDHDRAALNKIKSDALDGIRMLYFAYGCKVFASEGQFAALKQEYYMAGHNAMVSYRILDLHWPDKITRASQNGLDRSGSEGCDYWKQNIEDVSNLRRQAMQAVRESLPYNLR